MSLMKYDPFFSVHRLQDDINRLFSGYSTSDSSGVTADWIPSVDINEFDEKFQLYVDVPGVDPKDVEITLESGVLTITGERFAQAEKAEENVVRRRAERAPEAEREHARDKHRRRPGLRVVELGPGQSQRYEQEGGACEPGDDHLSLEPERR